MSGHVILLALLIRDKTILQGYAGKTKVYARDITRDTLSSGKFNATAFSTSLKKRKIEMVIVRMWRSLNHELNK